MAVTKGSQKTEVGVIPKDWHIVEMKSIARVIRGASPRPKGDPRYYGGNVPRLMVEDITRDKHWVTPQIDYLTDDGAKLSRLCKRGTIAVVCSGTPSAVGLPAILAVDSCIHDGILGLVNLSKEVSTEFVFHKLRSYQHGLHAAATHGGTFVNLTTFGFGAFKLVLPSTLAEQEAIAEALSDADAWIESLEQLIAKKRQIKQGAMQELLTGKRRLPGFSGEWRESFLKEIVEYSPSGTYGLDRQSLGLVSIPVATTAQISNDDRWNGKPMNARYFTLEQAETYGVKQGDLIVVKSSGSAASIQSGKMVLVDSELSGSFLFSNFLMRLRPRTVGSHFLYYYLTSSRIKKMLPSLCEASTYPNIRINEYLEIRVPLPSIAEQTAIATVLSDMDSEIESLESKLAKAREIKQGMMQELLTGRIRLV